jgi:pimeloyl-ACP methyl ester carboxylesterase
MQPKCAYIYTSLLFTLGLPSGAYASHDHSDSVYQYSYFINGLASAIPEVGKGLDVLSDRIGGTYFAYVTPIESTLPITTAVVADIRKKLLENPNAKFNIIGTSYGGNIATLIASRLNQLEAKVNYLAIIDAPAPFPIPENVHRADNFVCKRLGCIGQQIKVEQGNDFTWIEQFDVESTHIALSSNAFVHERIIGQLTEIPMHVETDEESK